MLPGGFDMIFFDEICQKHEFKKIALGHHMNDNAELILMYLLRGSGPNGISGIPPMRGKKIVRPLMDVTRSEIETFMKNRKLSFVTDSSNTDPGYTRNRIRHFLLPRLEHEYNPHVIEALHRLGGILRDENRWMDDMAAQAMASCIVKSEAPSIHLSTERLCRLPIAARRRILRKAIEQMKGNLLKITFDHVEQVLKAVDKSHSHKIFDLPDRIRIIKTKGRVQISKEAKALRSIPKIKAPLPFSYDINGPGCYPVPEIGISLRITELSAHDCPEDRFIAPPAKTDKESGEAGQHIAFFDMETIGYPLHVRNPMQGDRFIPLGMKGSQKISRFFINKKVPIDMRRCCPIFLYKEQIIWVAGHRMDDAVKVTRQTRRILKAELLLA